MGWIYSFAELMLEIQTQSSEKQIFLIYVLPYWESQSVKIR